MKENGYEMEILSISNEVKALRSRKLYHVKSYQGLSIIF